MPRHDHYYFYSCYNNNGEGDAEAEQKISQHSNRRTATDLKLTGMNWKTPYTCHPLLI